MKRQEDIDVKVLRVRRLLQEQGWFGAFFMTRASFAWITGGGDNHIPSNSEMGEAGVLVTLTDYIIVTNNIEAPRLRAEECAGIEATWLEYSWHEPLTDVLARVGTLETIAADAPVVGCRYLPDELNPLRFPLTKLEVERIKELGQAAASITEDICFGLKPGVTEWEVAGRLHSALLKRGIEPTVTLVAHDERIARYRHPIPTEKPLQRHGMIVCCSRKYGLTVALTRVVHVGPIPDSLLALHQQVAHIESVMIDASKAGTPYQDVLQKAMEAYRQAGYPDEWQLHHQGGPVGYANREFLVTASTAGTIQDSQALAWNPSITGSKSEDTILVQGATATLLTQGAGWPTIACEVNDRIYKRPAILQLSYTI
ncbi:M24 family metallopeptidase [Brevibacillus sp. TJ4]|uniref:M24 family metallopeptidase n=1 Tax=Brevibacillus sp. TJ4 TaxID=3234853 RepID=UPI0037D13F6C